MEEKELENQTAEGTPETSGSPAASAGGRRLAAGAKGGWKLPVLIIAITAAVLLAAYLGLCAFASNSGFLPGTTMLGVELKGKTNEQLQQELEAATQTHFANLELPVNVDGQTVTLRAADAKMGVNLDACFHNASATKHGFFASGAAYLSALVGRTVDVPCGWTIEDQNYVNQVVAQAASLVRQPVRHTNWEIEEGEEDARLVLTRGMTGQAVDEKDLKQRIEAALLSGTADSIDAVIVTTPPQEPSFDGIAAEVDREPMDAALDVETDEVIPHRLGVKLDPAKAKAVYDTLAEGESGTVELEVTQPEVTTLELRATLFRDILGEGSSKISGDAARVNNVRLSAAACDGIVLLPGQQMSYNQTTGQRTTAKGYREATGYTAKGQEMMVGGGVCQPSSTLYMACLHANLEIVNRKNHMYTVSYMPEGVDATVSWPNLDYVFANNTKYPIKVSMTIENRVLTARIYGTKTDDTTVKLESVRLSTTPAGVSYEADPEIPRGTTKVLQGAHTGKKVEVYKNTYAADGTLLSREWISTDTYRPSDKIIGYNPLDGVPEAGIAPVPDPNVPPVDPSVTPAPTPPAVDPTAAPSVPPVEPSAPVSEPPAADPSVTPPPGEPSAEPTGPVVTPPAEAEPAPTVPPPEGIPED